MAAGKKKINHITFAWKTPPGGIKIKSG